jgi:hypothetical protein
MQGASIMRTMLNRIKAEWFKLNNQMNYRNWNTYLDIKNGKH